MIKEDLWAHEGVRGIRITLEAEEELKSHSTPGKVFIVCCDGKGEVSLHGQRVPLKRGDVLEIGPGVPHGVKAEDRLTLYLTVFTR